MEKLRKGSGVQPESVEEFIEIMKDSNIGANLVWVVSPADGRRGIA